MPKADWSIRPLDDELGEVLRAELLSWPGAAARPMMGTLAFYHRRQMLGCYVNRDLVKTKPDYVNRPSEPPFVWVRLRPQDAARALKSNRVRPLRLFTTGWVEIPLAARGHLEEAVRWFGCAYEHPPRGKAKRSGAKSKRRKGVE
jgi:hypothetical protein